MMGAAVGITQQLSGEFDSLLRRASEPVCHVLGRGIRPMSRVNHSGISL